MILEMVNLAKIEDTPHLLDILISMEDVLDSLDIYVYKNWFKGEVVEGPIISKHWLSFSLLYPHTQMPDPKAAFRLLKHGIKVEFSKVERPKDKLDPIQDKPKEHHFWMVKVTFPRRLIDQKVEYDAIDDEIEMDDVQDGKDDGLTDTTGLVDGPIPDMNGPSPDEENASNVQPI